MYTKREQEQKNYTVADALKFAERRLKAKNIKGACINAIVSMDYTTPITLERANSIADRIVEDSGYYN